MDITFKGCGITASAYLVPSISEKGWVAAWKGRHARWNHGFVVRVLWLGFVLRWGKKTTPLFTYQRGVINNLIEQANDGDHWVD